MFLLRFNLILWGASVTERHRARHEATRARISNLVSEGQCHLIYITIPRRFSWPILAYMYTKLIILFDIREIDKEDV